MLPSMAGASEPLKKRVGKLLKAQRAKKGWTQHKLADQARVSYDMVIKIETGRSGASFATVERLANALGVDPSALFGASPYEGEEWSDLHGMMAMVAVEPPETQAWLIGIIAAALKPKG